MTIYRRVEKNLELLDYECAEHVYEKAVQGTGRSPETVRRYEGDAPDDDSTLRRSLARRDCAGAPMAASLAAQAGGRARRAARLHRRARLRAAGRGAPPAPANYPPYTRPVSTYVPPRTPDGQPDISGLYLAIPLPRNIETPLVPMANRAGESRQRRVLVQPQRAAEAAGGGHRASGRRRSGRRQDSADSPRRWRSARRSSRTRRRSSASTAACSVWRPAFRAAPIPAPVVGYQIFQKPGYVVIFYEQSHLYRDDPARRPSAARPEHQQGDGRVARPLGRQHAGRRGDELHDQLREQLGDRRGLRDAGYSRRIAGHRPRHSAQRSCTA